VEGLDVFEKGLDLFYHLVFFTWFNKQIARPILKKLERILADDAWRFLSHNVAWNFLLLVYQIIAPVLSKPVLLLVLFPKPFRFFDH
jgi:hypothetical protein